MTSTDLIGAGGVSLVLLAYLLHLTGRLRADSPVYAALNTVGAGLACAASLLLPYWPFVVLEGTWALVSLGALVQALRRGPTEP